MENEVDMNQLNQEAAIFKNELANGGAAADFKFENDQYKNLTKLIISVADVESKNNIFVKKSKIGLKRFAKNFGEALYNTANRTFEQSVSSFGFGVLVDASFKHGFSANPSKYALMFNTILALTGVLNAFGEAAFGIDGLISSLNEVKHYTENVEKLKELGLYNYVEELVEAKKIDLISEYHLSEKDVEKTYGPEYVKYVQEIRDAEKAYENQPAGGRAI